jgi:hypothetical protein
MSPWSAYALLREKATTVVCTRTSDHGGEALVVRPQDCNGPGATHSTDGHECKLRHVDLHPDLPIAAYSEGTCHHSTQRVC